MMKTVKLLKRNHKNSVDELKVRDTSCPKGKKVELKKIITIGIFRTKYFIRLMRF